MTQEQELIERFEPIVAPGFDLGSCEDCKVPEMAPHHLGRWVRYEDFATLRAQLEKAREVKPLTFSDQGYAHNGLGTMYRITFHNDAYKGWVLYRHEGSSQTGLGSHEDREELEGLANKDNERRIHGAMSQEGE